MTRERRDSRSTEPLRESPRRRPSPAARKEFRDRLRGEFIRDAISVRGGAGEARRAALRFVQFAAALATLLIAFLQLNSGPRWKLVTASGSGVALVDGRAMALDSPDLLARALKPGARVRLPEDAQLDLVLPGLAMLQIVGGSEATLPGSPGRWLGRTMRAALSVGELRLSTGSRFAGARFDVETPEMRAVVTGTTLAVLRPPGASCVCVFEGKVAMLTGSTADTVDAGFRRSVFRDGSAPIIEPIRPMETMKLSMLRDQAGAALAR